LLDHAIEKNCGFLAILAGILNPGIDPVLNRFPEAAGRRDP
jgi:hypothetical protein